MDASRCVVIEFDGASQEALLKYLSKNCDSYNWILTAFDEIRVCVWWVKNVEFSTTPLRSFLKRFKSKMVIDSYLKISRKMTTREGVRKVYNGNGPVMLTLDALQRSSIYYLIRPVREHVVGLMLTNNPGQYLKEPNNEEPCNEEPSVEETFTKVDDSAKLDLLLKITARIATQIKNLKKLPVQPEVVEVMEDASSLFTHADEVQPEVVDESTPKQKFNISKLYCNRDPITGECDGDPRGHFHPF